MEKIKKDCNVKIIAIFIALVFSLNTIAYGIELSHKTNLRIPLLTAASSRRLEESLKQRPAIDSLIKKLSSISSEDITQLISDILLIVNIHYSINKCFNRGWPGSAGQLAIEAIKNNIQGITPELVTKSINECSNKGLPDQAGQIVIEAIKNNIQGITSELVTKWINECFNKDLPYQAGQIAIEAIKIKRPSKNAQLIVNLLRDPAIFIEDGLDFIARITCYALQAGRLNDLYTILPSLKHNKHIFGMLRTLTREEGYDVIIKEVFENKGIEHFVILYNNIYENIFNNLLPDGLSITDKRTNLMLRYLVHFDTSEFSRNDLTFEEVYNRYEEAYGKGNIKSLPDGIPKPRIIEVATRRAGSITQDAQTYFNSMIGSMKKALSIIDASQQKGEPLFKDPIEELIISIAQEISNLEEKMAKDGLLEQAKKNIQEDLNMLYEARSIMESLRESDVFPLGDLNISHLKAMSKIKNIGTIIRVILFTHALQNNLNWQAYFREHIEEPVSLVNIAKFIEFVDSFIKLHLLENLGQKTREKLLVYTNTKIFREELGRLSQERTQFTRRIRLVPLRGWVAEFIGYFSDECWTKTLNIMRDNPDTIALVIVDDDTNELLGSALLMPNSVKGEKVLIDRGLSPRTEVTAGLNMDDFVLKVTDYEEKIARVLGATKILVLLRNLEPGLGSNNPDIIQYYERTLKDNPSVNLDTPNTFNDHDITHGRCVVLRNFSSLQNGGLGLPGRSHSSDL